MHFLFLASALPSSQVHMSTVTTHPESPGGLGCLTCGITQYISVEHAQGYFMVLRGDPYQALRRSVHGEAAVAGRQAGQGCTPWDSLHPRAMRLCHALRGCTDVPPRGGLPHAWDEKVGQGVLKVSWHPCQPWLCLLSTVKHVRIGTDIGV